MGINYFLVIHPILPRHSSTSIQLSELNRLLASKPPLAQVFCRSVETWVTCWRYPGSVLHDGERTSQPMEQVPKSASRCGVACGLGRKLSETSSTHSATRDTSKQDTKCRIFLLILQFCLQMREGCSSFYRGEGGA